MRRGRRALIASTVGAVGIFALGLGLSLASGAAANTTRWPGPLRLVEDHPWLTTAVLGLISAGLAAVTELRRRRESARRELRPGVVERVPDWVVGRVEVAQAVAAVVRAGSGRTVGITTGVYGAGGFGKTTVAQLVCNEREVRRRFGEHVYLVTVGRATRSRSQIAAKVAEATMLTTGMTEQFADPQAAGAHLDR